MEAPTTRPYRSKRQKPCDRCRKRKTACIQLNGIPCQGCQGARRPCTFNTFPTRRRRPSQSQSMNSTSMDARSGTGSPEDIISHLYALPDRPLLQNGSLTSHEIPDLEHSHDESLGSAPIERPSCESIFLSQNATREEQSIARMPEFALGPDTLGPFLQRIRSLESQNGLSAQLTGSSGESDPWLLRHCRYDEYGMCPLSRLTFRTVGGVPYEHLVPVQFIIRENSLYDHARDDLTMEEILDSAGLRDQLNNLVPESDGRRLISL